MENTSKYLRWTLVFWLCLFRATLTRQWKWQSLASICEMIPSSQADETSCSCFISNGTFAVTSDMFDPKVNENSFFFRSFIWFRLTVACTWISTVSFWSILIHWFVHPHHFCLNDIDHVKLSSVFRKIFPSLDALLAFLELIHLLHTFTNITHSFWSALKSFLF